MKKIGKRIAVAMLISSMFLAGACSEGILQQVPGIERAASVAEAATMGQRNALTKAKQYLSFMAFSKKGLKRQLKYEGYTNSEVNYAVKHCGANWKKQAVKKAKEYLKTTGFSKSGLKKQLLFEGFTNEQANYAVKKVYR